MAKAMKLFTLAATLLATQVTAYKAAKYAAAVDAAIKDSSANTGFQIQYNQTANVTELTPQYFTDLGSKRAELRYGPFPVQPMDQNNGMNDYVQYLNQLPCDDCTITYVHAGLEYEDGSYANANTSLWLHHVVMINLGVEDTVCGYNYYAKGQRWFASGNERTVTDMSLGGHIRHGYYLKKDATSMFILELMNQALVPQTAVLTITYEWVPGKPADFYEAIPIWLDIGGCHGASDMPVLSDTSFNYTTTNYQADFDGAIIGMGGHLHDGGTYINIVNGYSTICQVQAFYGQTGGYWDQAGMPMTKESNDGDSDDELKKRHGDDGDDDGDMGGMMGGDGSDGDEDMGTMRMPHISSMGYCYAPAGFVKSGDILNVQAFYNFTEYSPMVNWDGSDAEIMGISLIYVAANMTQAELTSIVGNAAPNPYPNGSFVPHLTPVSPGAPMTCVPFRDSPGTLSTKLLDLKDPEMASLYLMAILDDACLQVWSQVYVHGYWIGIGGAIVLFALINRGITFEHALRRRKAAQANVSTSSGRFGSMVAGIFRKVSYPQISNLKGTKFFKVPSFGTSILIGGYAGFLCLLSFLHANTHDDQRFQSVGVRAAWISVAQVPLLVALAMKRNFVGMITGVSYERLNVLHRWVARGLLLTTTLHFGYQSYGWARLGLMKLEWTTDECPPTGIAAYVFVLWMNLSTLAPFRNMAHEFFVIQHILTFVGTIATIMYHIPDTALSARNYIWAAIGIYIASRLFQTVMNVYHNIRPSRATLTPVSTNVTKVTIPNRYFKSWTPGAHVLVRLPGIGFYQSHPLTIASTPASHNSELVFFVRSHSGFTRSVYEKATTYQSTSWLALLDGPYGGSHPDFGSYSTVVLIASSTGVSFTLPILLDLAERASNKKLPVVKRINFVWTVKNRSATNWIPLELRQALQTLKDEGITTSISVHVTSGRPLSFTGPAPQLPPIASRVEEVGDKETRTDSTSSAVEEEHSSSDSGSGSEIAISPVDEVDHADLDRDLEKKEMSVTVRPLSTKSSKTDVKTVEGRADIVRTLHDEHDAAVGDMGVAVCGNLELSASVRNAVARMQCVGDKGVGLHVEGFSW